MKHPELDPAQECEYLRQQAAEVFDRQGADAADGSVQRYRFVYQVLRQDDDPGPPADFAATMERLTRDHEESARVETWLVRGIAVATLAVAASAAHLMSGLWLPLVRTLAALPWHAFIAAGSSLALAWALDRLMNQGRKRACAR